MIDRTYCARPTIRGGAMVPCGMFARIVAPAESSFTWAYCHGHAIAELGLLDLGISQALAAGEDATDRMRKAEALRSALAKRETGGGNE
jgi:hypothetical protein